MQRTRVKICGMRDPKQVQQLVELGVDAIGMIFYPNSPRNVTLEQAKKIRQVVPAFVSLVGVFVDSSAEEINQISADVGLNTVQLHGDQDIDFAKKITIPYIKVVRVKDKESISHEAQLHAAASALLLDTYSTSEYGGTGHKIDNSLLPSNLPSNTILAGGINVDNIESVLVLEPYAVDVNSGVELSPANKDLTAIQSLLKKIRNFDRESR